MVGKRKKKGRPSLLDLHKRSLRSPQNPNSTNHNHNENRHRRHTRRNPLPPATSPETNNLSDGNDEDEDEDETERRREKKLKLVLKLQRNGDDDDESDHNGPRRIRNADQQKTHSSAWKATEVIREIPSVSGPTTPLPDKKLLLFVLDKLQKKDTYGVFSEPVDPEELPDYHDVIKHPMDFTTIRRKLDSGAYYNLEQFEKDVFLISSNAMTYNAPDTVYHRQARAIEELAKKNFEELRHESDGEPDIKLVRRGRPSLKTLMKKTPGRPTEHAISDLSSIAMLSNSRDTGQSANIGNDASKKGHMPDKHETAEPVMRSYAPRETRTYSWTSEHKFGDEITASLLRGGLGKNGTKMTVIVENRRNTYKQPIPSTFVCESPMLNTFDGERKQLVPVGLYIEHAYARSLARFAANLGPVGWEIAAQRIQKSLPPGTKFGRGWVGNSEAPQKSQLPLLVSSPPDHSQSRVLPTFSGSGDNKPPERQEPSSSHQAVEEGDSIRNLSPVNASQTRNSDAKECHEGRLNLSSPSGSVQPKTPFQAPQNATPPTLNGRNHHAFGFDSSPHAAKMSMVREMRPPGNFNVDPHMSNTAMLNMASKGNIVVHQVPWNHVEVERARLMGAADSSNNNMPQESASDSLSPWRVPSQISNPKRVSAAPDLNVSFQSPSSPASQQPDLALQL